MNFLFKPARAFGEAISNTITCFQISFSEEKLYINPPRRNLIRALIIIWITVFVILCLSVGALAYLLILFWIPLIIVVYEFLKAWRKYGYSEITFYFPTLVVISLEIFIVKFIRNLIFN